MQEYEACNLFVEWLERRVIEEGRGSSIITLPVEPSGKFWLGRLAPEVVTASNALGDMGERLDPCAMGIIFKPDKLPCRFDVAVRFCIWNLQSDAQWHKATPKEVIFNVLVDEQGSGIHGAQQIQDELKNLTKADGLAAEVRTELIKNFGNEIELSVTLVNTSPATHVTMKDTNLYESSLRVINPNYLPFMLEALPDSFRYDRTINAYGINCGVLCRDNHFETCDAVGVNKKRPNYWNVARQLPDFKFTTLCEKPIPSLQELVDTYKEWSLQAWSASSLEQRKVSEHWTPEMREEARTASDTCQIEISRLELGLNILKTNDKICRAFRYMNAAMNTAAKGRYFEWRPFQLGFIVSNIAFLVDSEENEFADIVWFATGGGKTETYLGLVLIAAFYDRIRGKVSGITAWNRFPLRMLSLQQTQRFLDAIAAAEIVRQKENIPGDIFSLGFLVGQNATPNRFKPNAKEGDLDFDTIDGKFKILLYCPFCFSKEVITIGNHVRWTLEHRCQNKACPWGDKALPFYIVDDEIYRFLPTVVVGTLDKAATISTQAAMRGFIGAPWGKCSKDGHGFTYAIRSASKNGCLVPDCTAITSPLPQTKDLFAPTLRLQDELHLLKDSLGAVDAHYESLLDALQRSESKVRSKILASSATLAGYQKQAGVLYCRQSRVFPSPGPRADYGFWTSDSDRLARRYTALSPRGVTLEYVVDQMITVLQRSIRELIEKPMDVCREIGIDESFKDKLIEIYGVNVVYGNTIKDLDAVLRSFQTQIQIEGSLNSAVLTGKTDFDEVRTTLDRLNYPENDYYKRIHLVAASSMMSHGVDIDRLNLMVILGLPLTTAEFIQASARVGRRYPGLVFVIPKVARERDAGVYRSFEHFVLQGDRFVEPVPVGRRSRRVLQRTLPGLFLARVNQLHEYNGRIPLTMIDRLKKYFASIPNAKDIECSEMIKMLEFNGDMDEELRKDIRLWFDDAFRAIDFPPSGAKFINETGPNNRPMMSLRDVEEQVPIYGVSGI